MAILMTSREVLFKAQPYGTVPYHYLCSGRVPHPILYCIRPCTIITHVHRATWASAYHSQATCCVIMSGFRAALDMDTYPLSNLIRPRCTEWGKPGRA